MATSASGAQFKWRPWFSMVAVLALGILCMTIYRFQTQTLSQSSSSGVAITLHSCSSLSCIPRPRRERDWEVLHQQLKMEAEEIVMAPPQRRAARVIFFGDSITEHLRGTSMGVARPDLEEARAVFQEDLAGPFSAKALGIAGDQTGHLLWRLGDGELPLRGGEAGAAAAAAPLGGGGGTAVAVLLIGTNNLKDPAMADGDIAQGVGAAAAQLLRAAAPPSSAAAPAAAAAVLVLALFPRHGLRHEPSARVRQRVENVNAAVAELVASRDDPRLAFLDCGAVFLNGGGEGEREKEGKVEGGSAYRSSREGEGEDTGRPYDINPELMPDFLHPSAKGYHKMFSECLIPAIRRFEL